MNCSAPLPGPREPFPDDDPFLPHQDARIEDCPHCGIEHRTDFGCETLVSESGRMRVVVWMLGGIAALVVAIACAVGGLIG